MSKVVLFQSIKAVLIRCAMKCKEMRMLEMCSRFYGTCDSCLGNVGSS